MVILITCNEVDERTKEKRIVVSHGYDTDTGETICLPAVPPDEIGKFNNRIGEWILK